MNGPLWYRGNCPNCGNVALQQHSSCVWCVHCGWARNRYDDPATGRAVARWGLRGTPERRSTH